MPFVDDLLDRLAGARYVTMLDLSKGYWHIALMAEGRECSAFITPLDWPIPQAKKQVLAFLGTANYYRKFVLQIAAQSPRH